MYPEHIVELYEAGENRELPSPWCIRVSRQDGRGTSCILKCTPISESWTKKRVRSMTEVVSSLITATSAEELPVTLDWSRVEEALATASGIPVAVASRSTVLAAGQGESAD